MLDIFIPDNEDPGFMTGQWIRYNGKSYLITGIRCNPNGIWITLK